MVSHLAAVVDKLAADMTVGPNTVVVVVLVYFDIVDVAVTSGFVVVDEQSVAVAVSDFVETLSVAYLTGYRVD